VRSSMFRAKKVTKPSRTPFGNEGRLTTNGVW